MPVVRKPRGVFFLRKKMGLDPTPHANFMKVIDDILRDADDEPSF